MSKPVSKTQKTENFIARIIAPFTAAPQLEAEKARLEAFLAAFPGEYCGFAPDGSAAYSAGFCDMLGLDHIKTLADIQNQIELEDAAALEGLYDRLRKSGAPFTLNVQRHNDKNNRTLKLSGSQGYDLKGGESYQVIWIEDVTEDIKAQEEKAEQSQSNLSELNQVQSALNSIPRPVWLRDNEQNLVWCNTTYAEYLGTDMITVISEQKELAAQALKKKATARQEDTILPGKPLAKAAMAEGTAKDTTAHGVFQGKRLLLRLSEIPLGPLGMTLGIAYNITREEELETKLKRYQSSHHELLEQLHSAIAIFTADEKLEFYNAAFAQLWSLEGQWLDKSPKLGEIMEKLRETRRLPEQADFRSFKKSWTDMFTDLINPHEDMLYLPDGSVLRMLVVPHSMGGLMMTFEDVTSGLELESSYNTLIAVQKETLDNLGEAVAVFGGDGRLKLSNPAYSRLWGFHPEDIDNEPHITRLVEKTKSFFTEEEWPQRKEELISEGLDRLMHEGRMNRADGTLIDFATVPLPDGGVLVTYSDVTDKVRVETALREKNAALEAAEQLKLDFLANVSYQLRTPLNAIMGFNEILDQEYFGPLNDKQKEYTHDISKASQKLLDLINDILDLSTLEAGYLTLERKDIDIKDMLGHVAELISEWAHKKAIKFTLDCPETIGTINADERRIQQALINLIRNAINFTPENGEISLQALRQKEGLQIIVQDNGVGISESDQNRIFAPFERAGSGLQNAPLSKGGAGLGLSLVKNIINLHGGTVKIDSTENKGTTVTLFLPFTSTETSLKIPLQQNKA